MRNDKSASVNSPATVCDATSGDPRRNAKTGHVNEAHVDVMLHEPTLKSVLAECFKRTSRWHALTQVQTRAQGKGKDTSRCL